MTHYDWGRPIFLVLPIFLVACAGVTEQSASDLSESATAIDPAAEPLSPQTKVEIPTRPIPDESVYPLLLAEFALRRKEYGLALDNYMQQALLLRDAGVSERTSRLAQYLQKEEQAVAATDLWVELEPENLEARLTLGNLLARRGEAARALPHMAEIIRAGGNANFTALASGFSQTDDAGRSELILEVDQLLEEFPDNTQLIISKALMLESMGKPELALRELQAVFELDSMQFQAMVLDAKLRQDINRPEGMYDRIEAALAIQPENDRLRTQYARLLTRTDISLARAQFQILLDQSPSDPDLLFSLALIQREMGDFEAARDKLEKLVRLDQRRDEAHYYLGRIAERQERYEDALLHYMRVQPGRDFVNATRRLATILLVAHRLPEHNNYFNQLRERLPMLATQLFAVEVESLNSQQLYSQTIQVLDQALGEMPDATSLQYMRAMALEKQGKLAEMEADLRAILLREPDNATVLNALGYTLANKTRRYADALQLIERALALDPGEPAILDSYGWVHYRLGNYPQALKYLRDAYRSFPDPEVASHLGEVLWITGDPEGAFEIWREALTGNPDHEVVIEAMQRLAAPE